MSDNMNNCKVKFSLKKENFCLTENIIFQFRIIYNKNRRKLRNSHKKRFETNI